MSRVPLRKLGDFFRVKHGYAFKGEFFAPSGEHILLTPGNFSTDGGLKLKGEKEKFYTGPVPPDYVLERGDLIVAMTDLIQNAPLLGAPAFIPESGKFLHNQRLGKIVDLRRDQLDKRYLYYVMQSEVVRSQIRATATGSTVRHTAPERIYAVQHAVPAMEVQTRIAALLGAYDELIENNTRRIAILEEMARALYREWFVDLWNLDGKRREPKRWASMTLGEVITVNAASISANKSAPEVIEYVDIASVSTGRIDSSQRFNFAEAPGRARRCVRHGDTIWSNVRPNRRSFAFICEPQPNLVVSTGFTVLSPKRLPAALLYFAVSSEEFSDYLTNRAKGAAYPAVGAADFAAAQLFVPPEAQLQRFENAALPMLHLMSMLQRRNANLRMTRDLLLPKLISGELDVSHLPDPGPPAA